MHEYVIFWDINLRHIFYLCYELNTNLMIHEFSFLHLFWRVKFPINRSLSYLASFKHSKFQLFFNCHVMLATFLMLNHLISIESFFFFRVQKLIRENKVMIFSATYCSYCNVAKRTFDSLGTKYEAIELNKIEDGPELATDLKAITGTNYVSWNMLLLFLLKYKP